MDTRHWGPSGWQLLHLMSFCDAPPSAFSHLPHILPCKYCRQSTGEFMKESPPRKDIGLWLYELHNRVNKKLRDQSKDDKKVIDPGPDPSFESVRHRYESLLEHVPSVVPGMDFMLSLAYNFDPSITPREHHLAFWKDLKEYFPFPELRKHIIVSQSMFANRKTYLKGVYAILKDMSHTLEIPMPSFRATVQQLAIYKSGCAKKTYRGKTCRKAGGGRKTIRASHQRLLSL